MANNTQPLVTAVWLEYNDSDHFEPYFCPRCRQMVVKHKGNIVKEEPGIVPTVFPILVQCRLCKRNYQFIGLVKHVDVREHREDYFEYRIENYYK